MCHGIFKTDTDVSIVFGKRVHLWGRTEQKTKDNTGRGTFIDVFGIRVYSGQI